MNESYYSRRQYLVKSLYKIQRVVLSKEAKTHINAIKKVCKLIVK